MTEDPNFATTVASYLLLLHKSGVSLALPVAGDVDSDEAAAEAFDQFEAQLEAGGAELVEVVSAAWRTLEGAVASMRDVPQLFAAMDADDAEALQREVMAAVDRDGRVAVLRRAFFGNAAPMMVSLLERGADGTLMRRWHILEAVTETARLLDPNPWDDVAEEREMDLTEFAVRWELAGYEVVAIR